MHQRSGLKRPTRTDGFALHGSQDAEGVAKIHDTDGSAGESDVPQPRSTVIRPEAGTLHAGPNPRPSRNCAADLHSGSGIKSNVQYAQSEQQSSFQIPSLADTGIQREGTSAFPSQSEVEISLAMIRKEKVCIERSLDVVKREIEELGAMISEAMRSSVDRAQSLRERVVAAEKLLTAKDMTHGSLHIDNLSLATSVKKESRHREDCRFAVRELQQQLSTLEERDAEAIRVQEGLRLSTCLLTRYTRRLITECSRIDMLRTVWHNACQSLRGSIRVICRVRPRTRKECEEGATELDIRTESHDTVVTLTTKKVALSSGKETSHKSRFSFDRVFRAEASQEEVFVEISQLVQSALDGKHVAIFVYGQTGSGKTYTMEGDRGESRGIIPRSVELMFASVRTRARLNWKATLRASFIEIYNEQLRDLLVSREGTSGLEMKSDPRNGTHLLGLKEIVVENVEHFHTLLQRARSARVTAETSCNERSSRSHCMFQLKIEVEPPEGSPLAGNLWLVDLAGSERVQKANVDDERLKETQAINRSLSALGDVFSAMASRSTCAKHIPYRNSKLTTLLRPALSGEGKTLMFVNINPLQLNASETVTSLRFAGKVNSCMNPSRRNGGSTSPRTAAGGGTTPRVVH